ncbi:energy-coupling factor ABC transporter substrate-binding protein [Methanoculleus sp. FWC-SCC1]|uniref:Cobalt transport protein CbiN n=1 Tax=Methanoculleus frigidifontis TaxID=2584085 RepID=A0ABT8MB46_9EURY|nr:energy-coupling factor ABC transporter substrate-binding protein [Methanoculleus sp. FWC-SCC1]MDN7025153.1 energy-coupling factor ABC transporter substrate-binding protein [Methanoculleus sp. FWC-SCC1]
MKYALEIAVTAIIVIFAAVFLVQNAAIQADLAEGEEAWGGADGSAAELIESSGYEPWTSPLWEPPSGEIESLFFSLQAAIGAIVIGYFFGYWRGSRKTA